MGQIWIGSRVKVDDEVKPKHSYFFSVWFIKILERITNYLRKLIQISLKKNMFINIMFHGILFDQLIIIKAQFRV